MNGHSTDAQLALSIHGIQLAAYARGDKPPPDPDSDQAALIASGIDALLEIRDDALFIAREFEKQGLPAPPVDLAIACPALERWRLAVLNDRKRTPLERIAAWELTAVQCEANGDDAHAKAARETARSLAAASASSGRRATASPTAGSSAPLTGAAWQHP